MEVVELKATRSSLGKSRFVYIDGNFSNVFTVYEFSANHSIQNHSTAEIKYTHSYLFECHAK